MLTGGEKYIGNNETESIFKENFDEQGFLEEIINVILKSKRAWRALDKDNLQYEKYKRGVPENF